MAERPLVLKGGEFTSSGEWKEVLKDVASQVEGSKVEGGDILWREQPNWREVSRHLMLGMLSQQDRLQRSGEVCSSEGNYTLKKLPLS